MIANWKPTSEGGYGDINDSDNDYLDIWGVVKAKNEEDTYCTWFVPSANEWGAFGSAFGIDTSNYNDTYRLMDSYWSSSLSDSMAAYYADLKGGYVYQNSIPTAFYLRLAATF